MPVVHLRVDDGVAVVTLDDPERRNALSTTLVGELVATLDALDASEEVGAVVVTGAPPAFCAGADLSELGSSRESGLRGIYEGFLRVARMTVPTIAAVNGPAVGAGMNLALACDVRIAARSARFDTRFLQLGVHPGGGHTWMLRRLVGEQVATAMVLCGEVLDGDGAARRGLAWRCVDDGELLDEAEALAGRAAAVPRELARRTKQTLRDVAGIADHDTAVERELGPQLWSMDQPEFATRLAELTLRISRPTR
ncbi:enoyl-CoA hydratase [Rhabdothermincola sediminis]|uniref:enoyl-CoA hydratase n=1 Tax=Rhabdothermincola sediminis TaxID=2751370 RepID=UPI001AA014A6|nr:enoyl-CoA hydratase [Rhabdothermincola sediminis]